MQQLSSVVLQKQTVTNLKQAKQNVLYSGLSHEVQFQEKRSKTKLERKLHSYKSGGNITAIQCVKQCVMHIYDEA